MTPEELEAKVNSLEQSYWRQTIGVQVLAASLLLLERILLKDDDQLAKEYTARLKEIQNLSISAVISPNLIPDVEKSINEVIDRPWKGESDANSGPQGDQQNIEEEAVSPESV
jgi:hypothetical protein